MMKSQNAVQVSISLSDELQRYIEKRAQDLGMKKSEYIAHLIRNDRLVKGDFVVREVASGYKVKEKAKA
jgi:hypothetical protein